MGIFQDRCQESKDDKITKIYNRVNDYEFYAYLAPYDINTGEIDEIKFYKVKSSTRVIDFIESTFPRYKRNILHVYNIIDSLELDKYSKFSSVLQAHGCFQFVYCYEDEKIDKNKYKKIRPLDVLELETKSSCGIDLYFKNLQNKNELTKKFTVLNYQKINDFIKKRFNRDLILICKGEILNEEKSFQANGIYERNENYKIYYFEKNQKNLFKNEYILGNYLIIEKINGKIYKTFNVRDMKEYAMKENNLISNDCRQVLNELNSLSNLSHQYLAKYHESFIQNNFCYTIMELCPEKNLYNLIQEEKNKNRKLNEIFIWEIIIKICIGIAYLHQKSINHGNLKTSNIFIQKNGDIKIADYGFNKLYNSSINDNFSEKTDLWKIGYILYELSNKSDFSNKKENTTKEQIIKSNYLDEINCYSDNIKKALTQMLENSNTIYDFLVQDYIIKITEKVGLLNKLYELYPSLNKNQENNIMNHVYYNILKRNGILNDSIFNLDWNIAPNSWSKIKKIIGADSLDYYPPYGWIGIGLNINKYGDDKNWIDEKNGWATAYHGLRFEKTKDQKYRILNCNEFDLNLKLELTIKSIIEYGLKDGVNQPFKFERNSFPLSRNKYLNCEEGVYLSFQIEEAKRYTTPISEYIFVLMCKVYPYAIRESKRFKGEFVADGNYVRPYRILAQQYK